MIAGNQLPILFAALLFTACNFSFKGNTGNDTVSETWDEAKPLQEIYKNYFLMGNIISPSDLNTMRFDLLKRHYNTVTAENHMKPSYMAPSANPASDNWAYRFSEADRIVSAALDAGMKVVGHTLIWHSQSPAWLTTGNKETVLANLEKYVSEVAGHFAGKLIAWDVVNEAMRDGLTSADANGSWRNCLRLTDSGWNRAIGPEYIERAFLAARAADPHVKLYYNDYNLNNPNKARAVFNMVRDINERYPHAGGRPLIDGIGMQSHHHIKTNPQTVETSINLFSSLQVEISITELDILAAGKLLEGNPPWNNGAAQQQADQYAAMFRIFKAYASDITRVTFWGIDDGTHWRTLDGNGGHGTLLNKDYSLKPAFFSVTNP